MLAVPNLALHIGDIHPSARRHVYNDHIIQMAARGGSTYKLLNYHIPLQKQNSNFLRILVYEYPWRGLAKIMRDATHDHSSFLMTANMQYLQFPGSMDTSKCTPDQPQNLCSSIIPSLHFCNTCLEIRCLPAAAGVVSKLLWHWMNTYEMFLCI